jgi:hypothetical protein
VDKLGFAPSFYPSVWATTFTFLLQTEVELASGFALMAQEIFDLVQEAEIGIQGQILRPTQGTPLALAALDSGWAFSSAAPLTSSPH